MAQRKLELLIDVVVKQQKQISDLIKQLEKLKEAGKGLSFGDDGSVIESLTKRLRDAEDALQDVKKAADNTASQTGKGFGDTEKKAGLTAQSVTAIATSFLAVQDAIQSAFAIAQTFYAKTIGLTEQLNQEVLANAANIAVSSKVLVEGVEQTGVDALTALKPKLAQITKEIDIATDQIAGVTEEQSRLTANALISKVSELQGQTKAYASAIDSLPDLTSNLVAALSTQGLADPTQIVQEIGDLAAGQIGPDSQLANALSIGKDDIDRARQQGELIDLLIERTQIYRDAANLAANSITNVTSNFQSLVERISRDATEDLLEPIATQLISLFETIQANEGLITSELKATFETLASIATQVGELLRPLGELSDEFAYLGELLLDILPAFDRLLEVFGPQITKVVEDAVQKIELLINSVEAVDFIFNLITGGVGRTDDAIQSYAKSTDTAANESLRLLAATKDIGDATEKEKKLLKEQTEARIKDNEAQIKALKELPARLPAQKAAVDAQISSLENWNTKLSESSEALGDLGDTLDVVARDLPDVADSYEEVGKRLNSALENLGKGSGGDLQRVSQNLETITNDINNLFDAGELTGDDAVNRLTTALEAPGLELQQKLALADQVRKINKTTSDERIALIGVELKEVQAGLSESERATAENVQKVSALRQQELQARIDQVAEAIRQEEELISQGAGSDRTLTQLKNQQRTLGAELKDLAVSQEKDLQDARIREIDRAQLDIQELTLKGRRSINQEEQALLQERARNAKLTEGQISARLAQLRAAASQEQLEAEIRLQEQRTQIFEEGSRKRREAELRLSELRLSLSEATAAREAADRQAAVAIIDTQIQQEQQLQQRQQQRLQLRQQAEDRILASLNTQRELFESQLNLISERNRLAQSLAGAQTEDAERALQIQQELANNENLTKQQRKQLEQQLQNLGFRRNTSEKKIAEEILQRKKEEIQLRAQDLEAQQAAERAQLQFQNQLRTLEAQRETRREQARVRELEFQQKLLQLEAQKAEASGDARAAQIAQEGVTNAGQAIQEQQQAVAAARAAEQATNQINQDATQSLAARQARESFQFARSVAQESQQLANELGQVNEKVGKRAQKFANQQDDIADAAAADAAQTLTSLQQLRTNSAIEELATAQQKASTELAALDTMNQQLAVATALADEAERRLAAVNALQDAVGQSGATLELVPSLDTGGALQSNRTTLIHAGELLIPGAPSRSAAVNAIATGQPIQAVRSDGFYKGPGGYVLNRQDVSSLLSTPSSISPTGTPAGNGISINGGTQVELSPGELVRQTELLNALVNLQQSEVSASAYERRLRRHKRA